MGRQHPLIYRIVSLPRRATGSNECWTLFATTRREDLLAEVVSIPTQLNLRSPIGYVICCTPYALELNEQFAAMGH